MKGLLQIAVNRLYESWRPFDRQLTGSDLVGAEVGVFRGRHAKRIVGKREVKTLFCVDRYQSVPGYEEGYTQELLNRARKESLFKLQPYDKAVFVYLDSVKAAEVITEKYGQLDFVYLDGDHSEEGVMADIVSWWPLIKPGGILGGHDFHYEWPGSLRRLQNGQLTTIERSTCERRIGG